MKDKNVSGEIDRAGEVYAPVRRERGDDWLWMVAADPAFYLEEIEGVRS